RREFEAQCLLFPVTGTRGRHLNLPTGLPPDRATDAEIKAYVLRIEAQIGVGETTPPGVANHTQGCGDTESESTHQGGDSVANDREADVAGLMSTQETREATLMSALLRNGKGT